MDNGLPVTPAASFTRNLLRVADFLPFLFGAAIVSMLLRQDSKRLGRSRRRDHRRASAAAPAEDQARRRRARDAGRAARAKRSSRDRRIGRARADADGGTARRARGARRSRVRRRRQGRPQRHAAHPRRRAVGDGQARMTPLAFEALYRAEWQELEEHLDRVLEAHEQAAERAASRRTDRRALPARVRASRAGASTIVSRVSARSPRPPDGRRASGHLSAARVRRRGAVAHRVARLPARRARGRRLRLDRDGALRDTDGRPRRARVLPTRPRSVRRRRRDGSPVRADVLPFRRVDRPHARRRQRLDDVRLLHQQQRRRRVPVLRERPRRGRGQHLLSRLQRRADRRGRWLSRRSAVSATRSTRSS